MIITDRFVYVHMPKTGGTFVAKVLERIHEARGDAIRKQYSDAPPDPMLRRVKRVLRGGNTFIYMQHKQKNGSYNQHGISSKIPREHCNKPILGTVRNPYDRYVSQYEFQWWRLHPEQLASDIDALRAEYPHFPDVSFEEFVKLSNKYFVRRPPTKLSDEAMLGRQTEQFATYYFKNPDDFAAIDSDYLAVGRFHVDLMPKLHLISTGNLNQNLHDFLLKMDYPEAEIAFILSEGKIYPGRGGRRPDQKWEKYYTPQIKAWVRQRERILFEMFPEFDI